MRKKEIKSKNLLIIGAGGQIPRYLIPMLKEQTELQLTLFSSHADDLPYQNVQKITGDANDFKQLSHAMKNQDAVFMDFDKKSTTQLVVQAMEVNGVQRIIQAGVLGVDNEVVEPFWSWNQQILGITAAKNRGNEVLEASNLDYTYMRMTWLYNGEKNAYVVSPKNEPFTGVQISRKAIAQFVIDNLTGKRNDVKQSVGLWEPGSENKPKPDWY
ncbi:NAD(P)H-binding protein [Bombilactobacillus folatiphilus]|uniref:NAD(P)H-binding protein n=1 Tax=Bombilactobacillus folatiphilus TaxID=2923362 RepID=A0ABY4PAJ8_9LACO|nr:NAD(P)H-binding protein [Bombilactobacillus folatiphilus]UQS82664.1 NAD(P)H-binding protein [Bombilactobacillus folatiphilus]